jgi:hypothetical protein
VNAPADYGPNLRAVGVLTQMKISGCHRSETTAKAWLCVRGYISTVRKHGDSVYDALTGNPWKPPATCSADLNGGRIVASAFSS